ADGEVGWAGTKSPLGPPPAGAAPPPTPGNKPGCAAAPLANSRSAPTLTHDRAVRMAELPRKQPDERFDRGT
ncbi:MAG: hypothetical protein K2V38_00590, partial [Gemmataceae bacterium]|nr:hypothetical protein [Gemmataceae bacterium]